MEDSIATFSKNLGAFCNHLQTSCDALKQSMDHRPIPLDSAPSSFVQCLNRRVETATGDLNFLDSMSFGTVSFEELLGHCYEVFNKNQNDLLQLEDRLKNLGYVPGEIDDSDEDHLPGPLGLDSEIPKESLNLPSSISESAIATNSAISRLEDDTFLDEKIISDLNIGVSTRRYTLGFCRCYPFLLEGAILAQEFFKAEPTDIFVCTPKRGTTWIKALTIAIVTRSCFDNSMSPLLSKRSKGCFYFGVQLPASIRSKDQGDGYHEYDESSVSISLEEAFELFCEGKSVYGPCWDYILGYWKASLERLERVFFLIYEDFEKDTAFYVKKLAEFMGYPFSLEEEQEGAVQKIVDLCSFENLSSLEVNNTGTFQRQGLLRFPNKSIFWKGKVEDWKNHLTPEMAGRLENEGKTSWLWINFQCLMFMHDQHMSWSNLIFSVLSYM